MNFLWALRACLGAIPSSTRASSVYSSSGSYRRAFACASNSSTLENRIKKHFQCLSFSGELQWHEIHLKIENAHWDSLEQHRCEGEGKKSPNWIFLRDRNKKIWVKRLDRISCKLIVLQILVFFFRFLSDTQIKIRKRMKDPFQGNFETESKSLRRKPLKLTPQKIWIAFYFYLDREVPRGVTWSGKKKIKAFLSNRRC